MGLNDATEDLSKNSFGELHDVKPKRGSERSGRRNPTRIVSDNLSNKKDEKSKLFN